MFCSCVRFLNLSDFIHRRQNVTLFHLHSLKWQICDDPWSHFLLKSIKFPVLRNLHLRCTRTYPEQNSVLTDLRLLLNEFVHHHPHLQTFDGDIRLVWQQLQADLFPETNGILSLRELEELHLIRLDIPDLKFIFDRLRICDRPAPLDLLPRLRVLGVQGKLGMRNGYIDDEIVCLLFRDFLKTRRTGNEWTNYNRLETVRFQEVCLQQADPFSVVDPEGLEVMRGLVIGGLRIELVPVDGNVRLWS